MKRIGFITVLIISFIVSLAVNAETRDEKYDFRGDAYYYKTAENFSGGSGTADDPFIITSWEELNLMSELGCGDKGIGLHFTLTENLYRNDGSVKNPDGGEHWLDVCLDPIGAKEPFQGVFDGGNHIIDTAQTYIFNIIGENGVVRNLQKMFGIANINKGLIENCLISTRTTHYESFNIGGIAGTNAGTIRRCRVEGKSDRHSNAAIVPSGSGIGGICGFNNGGTIEECLASISIEGEGTNIRAVGGIAGDNTGGIIRNCISSCRIVNKGSETGGIVGKLNYGTVENCLSTGYQSGSYELTGSIVGASYGNSKIINCRANGLMDGSSKIDEAQYGYETEELKTKALYNEWDLENVWASNGVDYPALRCFCTYTDCMSHWARDMIEELSEKGFINGYGDGTFGPDNKITRAEYIAMMFGEIDSYDIPYTDVPEWAVNHVRYAYFEGALNNIGISDTILGADEPITRLEAGVIAGRIGYGREGEIEFTDADKFPSWAVSPLKRAVSNKYISGYEDGSFRPDNTLTRAEAAAILYKIKIK